MKNHEIRYTVTGEMECDWLLPPQEEQLAFEFEMVERLKELIEERNLEEQLASWELDRAFEAYESEYWSSWLNRICHPLLYWQYLRELEQRELDRFGI
jgi:hypothetical protein